MNYEEGIKKLISATGIKEDDVFFFNSTPLENEFQKIYDFYSETLRLNSIYGIIPHHIYFKNDNRRNARAGKINGHFVVEINAGTIIDLFQRFNPGQTDATSIGVNLDKNKIGTDPNTLLYQFALHFTFYHEMAHLIQRSNLLEDSIMNLSDSDSVYMERKHLEELDADAFSSLCLATHVIQLFEDNFKTDNFTEFQSLVVTMCSTGMNYILSFNGVERDLYYHDNSHPHPVIRISCILNHMLEYIQQYFSKEIFTDKIRKEIIFKTFEVTGRIFSKEIIEQYSEKYFTNALNIKKYIEHFRKLEVNDQTLALYKWNKLIETEKSN